MPPSPPPEPHRAIEIAIAAGVAEVPAAEWDACACAEAADGGRPCDPFTTHRFLAALEASGSVGPGTGWTPRPLLARIGGRTVGVVPAYLKSHSQGEYIFDHGWADAWQRAGGRYYPKLQVAVPFTPATGRRLLVAPGAGPELPGRLAAEIARVAEENRLSSAHVTFCRAEEVAAADPAVWLHRITEQFHWENRGYGSFEDFLSDLASRKRKAIRKERAAAQAFGGTIRALTGDQIQPEHWDAVWAFYQDTGSRKWGRPYLTRAFFDRIHATMRQDILLILAERAGRPVAGALNFIGRDTLFGRYWGCLEDHPFMHFELCYYQAIDWAIANGLKRVEAGAQGEHKLARGYMPVRIHSLHWIADRGFRAAVARYLEAERAAMGREIRTLEGLGPFRRGGPEGAGDGPAPAR